MSGCSNYAENLWKKGKCSNCFRAKEQHNLESENDGLHNGDPSWSKPTYSGSKKLSTHTNGHSLDREQTSKKNSDDRKEFMLKSGKILGTTALDVTKTPLSSNQSSRQNGASDRKPASLKLESENIESVDKPRPTPRHRQRSSSKNSSIEEDFLRSPTENPSGSVTDFTLNGTNKSNTTTANISSVNKPGNSADSHSKQLNSGGICTTREKGLNTMEGERAIIHSTDIAKDNDGEYMPMNNNVCNDENTSADRKVEPIKISSENPTKKDDKSADSTNTKTASLDKANKQDSDERYNNISIDTASPIKLSSQANTLNDNSSDALNSEPFYENRSRVGSERSVSTSSEKSLGKTIISADRPDSLAFKVQIDVDEIRASSIFEDVIVEASGSSCATSSSNSSSNGNGSDSYDASADSPGQSQPDISTISELPTSKAQADNSRRKSNPDVTDLVEQPSYTNSSVKPQTKPYKVVDISAGILVPDSDADSASIPPLPPKEKELNRQKETSGSSDHYYYEPPDDIVPDYKKLTPLNTQPPPPPVIVKKDGQGATVPAALKSMPVPRPRSQVRQSYTSSTLPRPIPRAAKSGLEVKQQVNRPVSQVVTRPDNKDAPRPPSTSSIPTRKPVTEVSPPTSPTDTHAQSPKSSNGSIDYKEHSIKPRRTAPPPPVLAVPQSSAQPSGKSPTTLKDPRKETSQTTPSPTPSKSESKGTLGRSTIKRALSSWKRLSGRRKNKKRLDISSPIMVSEESDSTELGDDGAVCTGIKKKRGSTIMEQPSPATSPSTEQHHDDEDTIPLPSGKPGQPYQNFPFSKSHIEKPAKPDRPARAVKPVLQVKPEVNQSLNNQSDTLESPAYLEPCTGDLTLKVEAALANLNDAKILAETLSRVEQEKLGPLPQVPLSRQVHFRFNETVASRPVTAVSPSVVSQSRFSSRPASTHSQDGRLRSKSLTVKTRSEACGSSRARSGSTQEATMKKRYDKILELHRQTLQDMIDSSKEELLPGNAIDISNTRWNDYEICGEPLSIPCPGAVMLPVVAPRVDEGMMLLAKVKIPKSVTEDMSQRKAFMQDMATTVSLPFHVNVSRTITHFTDHLPAELFGQETSTDLETLVTITDQVPVETVQEFIDRTVQEHKELADEYERKVCILVLQILSALDHLFQEGVVHRGLEPSNLLLLDHGHVIVSNFSHVLHKSGGSTASSRFRFSKDSIGSVEEDPCRIPPEIHKALNSGDETIDFEKCDSFSVGCLIYELLHCPNPFAADPSLLSRDYTSRDLPKLTETSRFTSGLTTLASGLLKRLPSLRMRPKEALKLLQAFMFGPEELDHSCLEASASDWLETERAHAVIDIAHGAMIDGEEMIESFLKYQYLVNLTEQEIVDGYKALLPGETSV